MLITIFKLNPRGAETSFRESRWWWWPSLGPLKELAPSPRQVVSIPSSSIIGSGRNLVEWGVSHVVKHDSKADLEKLMYKTFILTPSLKMSTSLLGWWLGGHGRLGRYSWELWDFYYRVCVWSPKGSGGTGFNTSSYCTNFHLPERCCMVWVCWSEVGVFRAGDIYDPKSDESGVSLS